jgi:hypothetical protein
LRLPIEIAGKRVTPLTLPLMALQTCALEQPKIRATSAMLKIFPESNLRNACGDLIGLFIAVLLDGYLKKSILSAWRR